MTSYKNFHISDLIEKELHIEQELSKFFLSGKTKHIFDVLLSDYKEVITEIGSRTNYDMTPIVHYRDGVRLDNLTY